MQGVVHFLVHFHAVQGYLALITAWPVPPGGRHSQDVMLQDIPPDPPGSPHQGAASSTSLALSLACAAVAVFGSEWAAARLCFGAASLALVAVSASALGAAGRHLADSRGAAVSPFAGASRWTFVG